MPYAEREFPLSARWGSAESKQLALFRMTMVFSCSNLFMIIDMPHGCSLGHVNSCRECDPRHVADRPLSMRRLQPSHQTDGRLLTGTAPLDSHWKV